MSSERALSILSWNQRFDPRLRARRYERMRGDPHMFFRLTNPQFAADLAALGPGSGVLTWLLGDAHLENWGTRSTLEGPPIFDCLNFSEAMPGPFEWDLYRLAVSACLVADTRGVPEPRWSELIEVLSRSYLQHVEQLAASRLDQLAAIEIPTETTTSWLEAPVGAGTSWLDRYTRIGLRDRRQFESEAPVIPVGGTQSEEIEAMLFESVPTVLARYRRPPAYYRPLDVAAYLDSDDLSGREMFLVLLADEVVLLLEEAAVSSLAPFRPAFEFAHDAQRIMAGERVLSTSPDHCLGHTFGRNKAFIIRRFDPESRPVALEQVTDLRVYLETLGLLMARLHARGAAARDILTYVHQDPDFGKRLLAFAIAHSRQVQVDYAAFVDLLPS